MKEQQKRVKFKNIREHNGDRNSKKLEERYLQLIKAKDSAQIAGIVDKALVNIKHIRQGIGL